MELSEATPVHDRTLMNQAKNTARVPVIFRVAYINRRKKTLCCPTACLFV